MSDWKHVYTAPLTPLGFLERSAAVYPNKIAMVYGEQTVTYAEFHARVHRLAAALVACGLQRGDRVAYLCPNTPPMLEAHFGVLLAGGILVTVNTRLAPAEIQYILNHSGAKYLFIDTEFAHLVRPILGECPGVQQIINIDDTGEFEPLDGGDYEDFLATAPDGYVPRPLEDELDEITINYTSGTTGCPKGVVFTHRGAYINALGEVIETGLTRDSALLWTVPMFHCNGWCFSWALTAVGGTHICIRKFDPVEAWGLIDRHAITHINGAPVVLISLVNAPNAPEQFPRAITITTAGAPPSPTIIATVQRMGGHIIHVYGLTEVYGPFTVCAWQSEWKALAPAEQGRLLARQGVPYTVGGEVRVVDPQMQDVPKDGETMGEVVMRGNMVMKGYWDEYEPTATAFRGGYFHSGDLGVWHPDGYVELRDRGKDIIISGGENISSIEVEQVIYRHPAVLECAVIGIPSEKWGESPKAYVHLKEGFEDLKAYALIEHCRAHIAHFKCPVEVCFGPLPKTSTGKIQKFILREAAWAGFEKRIKG